MKIGIVCYSGTGNSLLVANKLRNKLEEKSHQILFSFVENGYGEIIKHITELDFLIICFPIYASYLPEPIRNFMDTLPIIQKNKIKVFYLITAGYFVGDLGIYAHKFIKNKGYDLIGTYGIILGNNMHLPQLSPLPVTSKKKLLKRINKLDKNIDYVVETIIQGKSLIKGTSILSKLYGDLQRKLAPHINKNFNGFCISESCIKCGWCIKYCPTHNIVEKDKKIIWKDNCILCMRCYNFCKMNAIKVKKISGNYKWFKRYQGPTGAKGKDIEICLKETENKK